MTKKKTIKLIIIIILLISVITIYFTGTYDYLKAKTINYFDTLLNKKGLELIKGSGSLIDKANVKGLEDSGIKGENYNFNSIDNAYYAILEDDEKEIYKQIYANIIAIEKHFKPVVKINKDVIDDIVEAVYNDHPELFWVETDYSYRFINEGEVVQITMTYNSTSKDIEKSKELFENSANKIIDQANTYSSIFYKEKYVHDTILNMNKYDENEPLNQSAYSALVTGKTVCAGYSRAFQYIMNKLGIRTYYISGDSDGDHAWNIVELEDEYYNVDLTWDNQKKISYRYFNVPDSVFSKTHIRKDLSIYLPVCRGTKYYNYENKNASKIIRGEIKEDKPGETIPRTEPRVSIEEDIVDDYEINDDVEY